MAIKLTPAPDNRSPIIVASHERSGTHFLMNSIANVYGYCSDPQLDFDQHSLPINFYYPELVAKTLLEIGNGRAFTNIVKTHHQAGFFARCIDHITARYILFYILRDPVKVMLSYWRFVHQWDWFEGPRVDNPISFSKAAPCGQLLRYQLNQHENMIARWQAHVEGWLELAEKTERIKIVRYEDLDRDFDTTLRSFGERLGLTPPAESLDSMRPARNENVVPGATHLKTDVNETMLREICAGTAGTTMSRLGYI